MQYLYLNVKDRREYAFSGAPMRVDARADALSSDFP